MASGDGPPLIGDPPPGLGDLGIRAGLIASLTWTRLCPQSAWKCRGDNRSRSPARWSANSICGRFEGGSNALRHPGQRVGRSSPSQRSPPPVPPIGSFRHLPERTRLTCLSPYRYRPPPATTPSGTSAGTTGWEAHAVCGWVHGDSPGRDRLLRACRARLAERAELFDVQLHPPVVLYLDAVSPPPAGLRKREPLWR